jgi:hypothetical protein
MVGTGPASAACPTARQGGAVRWFRAAWCRPDLALVAGWVTLLYCLFLFQGYQKLFRDSDAGWHIRSGEAILAARALPAADPYSFTAAGRPWFAWEWASDAATGAVHRTAGLSGVAMLYALAIAAGVWLWFRLHWSVGGDFLLACALSPLVLSTCNIHWLARPHVFGWLFLLASVLYAERHHDSFRGGDATLIAAGSALWANVHASFFLGPAIALIYAAAFSLRPLVWNLDRSTEWRRARWFGCAAAVSSLAGLLNPYGWRLQLHVARYLTDSALLSRIGEFQSFDFHAGGAQIVACLIVAVSGGALALAQRRPQHFILAVLLSAAALRSARVLPLVALVLLPLANGALTEWLRTASGLRAGARRALDRFLAYSGNLRRLDAGGNGWAVSWTAPALFWALLQTPAIAAHTGFPPDQFPVAAYARVAALPAGARLFAPDKFGGYLIYRYQGARKVFFDGRSDLYGAEFLKQYGRMVQLRPGWRESWDSFHFTHALLPDDYSLIPALRALGWRELHRDRTATLLQAPPGAEGGRN